MTSQGGNRRNPPSAHGRARLRAPTTAAGVWSLATTPLIVGFHYYLLQIDGAVIAVRHGEAKMELFDDIEVFYNQKRRHSTLRKISPAAFEREAA